MPHRAWRIVAAASTPTLLFLGFVYVATYPYLPFSPPKNGDGDWALMLLVLGLPVALLVSAIFGIAAAFFFPPLVKKE